MRSSAHGKSISEVEVESISAQGFWIYVHGQEFFLPYKDYPWFKDAKISRISNVQLLHGEHLYWTDLDIDLELESLKNPEKYPLVFK